MKDLKHISKTLKNISLSGEEKAAGRAALLRYMETNPLPEAPGFWARFYSLTRRPIWATATAAVLIVAFTGTATYASESALPGDLLYDFKVNVVEEVQGSLIFDEEKKAEWEAERMQKRLEEAEKLKEAGNLNPENKFIIRMHLKDHEGEFEGLLENLKDKGQPERAEEMKEKFEDLLDEQERIREEWKPDLQIRPFPAPELDLQPDFPEPELSEPDLLELIEEKEETSEETDSTNSEVEDEVETEIKLETELEFELE